jgi:hypothetical protein
MVLMKRWDGGRAVDPIRIQGFHDQKLKKKDTAENFVISFFNKKLHPYS